MSHPLEVLTSKSAMHPGGVHSDAGAPSTHLKVSPSALRGREGRGLYWGPRTNRLGMKERDGGRLPPKSSDHFQVVLRRMSMHERVRENLLDA